MDKAVIVFLLSALSACGYSVRAGGVRAINVAAVTEPGIDVDAAAVVGIAVRHAVARGPSTRLATEQGAEARLEVELLGSTSGLVPFADPSVRAAQYRAVVHVRGRLVNRSGSVMWSSPVIVGEAPYLSTPGPIETLDGARRRALGRAAEDAAERLVASMIWRQ